MSCCGGGWMPNSLGILISELKRGDEVIITKGEGYPAVPEDTRAIILEVDGFSALTVAGTMISCPCISQLVVTGNNFEITEISPEAQAILKEIAVRKAELEGLVDAEEEFDINAYLNDPDPLDSL